MFTTTVPKKPTNTEAFNSALNKIATKLEKLWEEIIFHYYFKYKFDDRYKRVPDLNLNIMRIVNNKEYSNGKPAVDIYKEDFIYYYKVICLYSHLISIIEVDTPKFAETYTTIRDNLITMGDHPIKIVDEELMTTDFSGYIYTDNDIKRLNLELKILMRNANNLYKDFKKYGDNEIQFKANCNVDDYVYLQNELITERTDFRNVGWTFVDDDELKGYIGEPITTGLKEEIADTLSDKFTDWLNSNARPFVPTVDVNISKIVLPEVDKEKQRESQLRAIYDALNCGIISKESAQKMVTKIILDSKDPYALCVEPKDSQNCSVSDNVKKLIKNERDVREQYAKLEKMQQDEYFKRVKENGSRKV